MRIFVPILLMFACVDKPIDDVGAEPVVDTEIAVVETDDTADTDPPPAVDDGDAFDASSYGERFWVAFMDNINPSFNGDPQFSVVVTADVNTTGTLTFPRLSRQVPFTVTAGEATEVFLPPANLLVRGSGVVSDRAMLVTADDPVAVAAVHYRVYFSDATSLLPEQELGASYTVIAVTDFSGGSPSEMLAVATTDGTTVRILPSATTVDGRDPGVPYDVVLDAGQAYQVQALGDLTGTRVQTDESTPIAVFGGARQAAVSCGTADSHVWDQVLPNKRLGTEYLVMAMGAQGGDEVVVVASDNGTVLRVDCGTPVMLDAGETWEGRVTDVMRLTANKPIGVGQINDSQDCNPSGVGDPSFQILSPSRLTTGDRSWIALPNPSIWQRPFDDVTGGGTTGPDPTGTAGLAVHWLNVLATAPVTVDDEDIPLFNVPGDPDLKWAQIPVEPGPHRVESEDPIVAHAYGFADYDAYTYHLGYDCEDCLSGLQAPATCQ